MKIMLFFQMILLHVLNEMKAIFQLQLMTAHKCAAEDYLIHTPRPPPDPDFWSLYHNLSKSMAGSFGSFAHESSATCLVSITLQLWLMTARECATEDSRSHLPRPPPLPDPTTDKSECKCMLQREYVVSIWRRGFRRANLTGVDLQETPTLHYNKSLIEFEAEQHCTPTGVCCSPSSRSVVPPAGKCLRVAAFANGYVARDILYCRQICLFKVLRVVSTHQRFATGDAMLLVKICFHSPQHMFIKGIDPIHPRFAIDGMLLVQAWSWAPRHLRYETAHNILCYMVFAKFKFGQDSSICYGGPSPCKTEDLFTNGFGTDMTLTRPRYWFDGLVPDCHIFYCNVVIQSLDLVVMPLSRAVRMENEIITGFDLASGSLSMNSRQSSPSPVIVMLTRPPASRALCDLSLLYTYWQARWQKSLARILVLIRFFLCICLSYEDSHPPIISSRPTITRILHIGQSRVLASFTAFTAMANCSLAQFNNITSANRDCLLLAAEHTLESSRNFDETSPPFYYCPDSWNSLFNKETSTLSASNLLGFYDSGASIMSAGEREHISLGVHTASEVVPLLCTTINVVLALHEAYIPVAVIQRETRNPQLQSNLVNCLRFSWCHIRCNGNHSSSITTLLLGEKAAAFMAHSIPSLTLAPAFSSVIIDLPAWAYSREHVSVAEIATVFCGLESFAKNDTSWRWFWLYHNLYLRVGTGHSSEIPTLSLGKKVTAFRDHIITPSTPSSRFSSVIIELSALIYFCEHASVAEDVTVFCGLGPFVQYATCWTKVVEPTWFGSMLCSKHGNPSHLDGICGGNNESSTNISKMLLADFAILRLAFISNATHEPSIAVSTTAAPTFMGLFALLHHELHSMIGVISFEMCTTYFRHICCVCLLASLLGRDLLQRETGISNVGPRQCTKHLSNPATRRPCRGIFCTAPKTAAVLFVHGIFELEISTEAMLYCCNDLKAGYGYCLVSSFLDTLVNCSPCSKRENVGCCADTYAEWCGWMLPLSNSKRCVYQTASACNSSKSITRALVAIEMLHTSSLGTVEMEKFAEDQLHIKRQLVTGFSTNSIRATSSSLATSVVVPQNAFVFGGSLSGDICSECPVDACLLKQTLTSASFGDVVGFLSSDTEYRKRLMPVHLSVKSNLVLKASLLYSAIMIDWMASGLRSTSRISSILCIVSTSGWSNTGSRFVLGSSEHPISFSVGHKNTGLLVSRASTSQFLESSGSIAEVVELRNNIPFQRELMEDLGVETETTGDKKRTYGVLLYLVANLQVHQGQKVDNIGVGPGLNLSSGSGSFEFTLVSRSYLSQRNIPVLALQRETISLILNSISPSRVHSKICVVILASLSHFASQFASINGSNASREQGFVEISSSFCLPLSSIEVETCHNDFFSPSSQYSTHVGLTQFSLANVLCRNNAANAIDANLYLDVFSVVNSQFWLQFRYTASVCGFQHAAYIVLRSARQRLWFGATPAIDPHTSVTNRPEYTLMGTVIYIFVFDFRRVIMPVKQDVKDVSLDTADVAFKLEIINKGDLQLHVTTNCVSGDRSIDDGDIDICTTVYLKQSRSRSLILTESSTGISAIYNQDWFGLPLPLLCNHPASVSTDEFGFQSYWLDLDLPSTAKIVVPFSHRRQTSHSVNGSDHEEIFTLLDIDCIVMAKVKWATSSRPGLAGDHIPLFGCCKTKGLSIVRGDFIHMSSTTHWSWDNVESNNMLTKISMNSLLLVVVVMKTFVEICASDPYPIEVHFTVVAFLFLLESSDSLIYKTAPQSVMYTSELLYVFAAVEDLVPPALSRLVGSGIDKILFNGAAALSVFVRAKLNRFVKNSLKRSIVGFSELLLNLHGEWIKGIVQKQLFYLLLRLLPRAQSGEEVLLLWRAFADNLQFAISNVRTSELDSFKRSFGATSDLCYSFIGVKICCCHNTCYEPNRDIKTFYYCLALLHLRTSSRASNMIKRSKPSAIQTLRYLLMTSLRLHQPSRHTYETYKLQSRSYLQLKIAFVSGGKYNFVHVRTQSLCITNSMGLHQESHTVNKQISDTFISLAILADLPSSSYREGVQDNNWLLYLQVMSFIWFLVCSLLTAHFALWRLHVITVKCRVSLLREDSHFARFASELFRTML